MTKFRQNLKKYATILKTLQNLQLDVTAIQNLVQYIDTSIKTPNKRDIVKKILKSIHFMENFV